MYLYKLRTKFVWFSIYTIKKHFEYKIKTIFGTFKILKNGKIFRKILRKGAKDYA
jgi:hypothetical protein